MRGEIRKKGFQRGEDADAPRYVYIAVGIGEAHPKRGESAKTSGSATLEAMEPSRDAILAALAGVIDPELQRPVTELDMVRDIEIEDGIVSLTIVLTIAGCPLRDSFERQVEAAFADVPGVRGFSLSFAVMTPEERQALTTKLRGGVERSSEIRLPRDCRVKDVASRAGKMARSTNLRIVGVIENMTGDVFGSGGGAALADELGTPLLGQVPLDPLLREQGDLGEPIVAAHPGSEAAQIIIG